MGRQEPLTARARRVARPCGLLCAPRPSPPDWMSISTIRVAASNAPSERQPASAQALPIIDVAADAENPDHHQPLAKWVYELTRPGPRAPFGGRDRKLMDVELVQELLDSRPAPTRGRIHHLHKAADTPPHDHKVRGAARQADDRDRGQRRASPSNTWSSGTTTCSASRPS